MTVKYIGHGEFPHPLNALDKWSGTYEDFYPHSIASEWQVTCVLDFGNGYIGLVESARLTPQTPTFETPQMRVTVIQLVDPSKVVRQLVIDLPLMGPIESYLPLVSAVTLGSGRVGICVTNNASNLGSPAGYSCTIISFESGLLSVGEWSYVADVFNSDYMSDKGLRTCLFLSGSNQVYLLAWGQALYIRRLELTTTNSMAEATDWVRVTDPEFEVRWSGRDQSVFVLVSGQIRGFLWRDNDALLSVQFRTDGGGFTSQVIDDTLNLGSAYSGGFVSHVVVRGDTTEVVYYKYKASPS